MHVNIQEDLCRVRLYVRELFIWKLTIRSEFVEVVRFLPFDIKANYAITVDVTLRRTARRRHVVTKYFWRAPNLTCVVAIEA